MDISSPSKKRKRAPEEEEDSSLSEESSSPSESESASDSESEPDSGSATSSPIAPSKGRTVKLKPLENNGELGPVIATTSAIGPPNNIPFDAYLKTETEKPSNPSRRPSGGDFNNASSELLLQSSAHPKFDFIAREGEEEGDLNQKHYLAVFDPKTHEVQVVRVPKLAIHQTLRPRASEGEDGDGSAHMTTREQRAALVEDFGTKKARKAAREAAQNAALTNVAEGEADQGADAVLTAVKGEDIHVSRDELNEAAQSEKPIPKHNPSATHPADVYPLETLVPNGISGLQQLPIDEWRAAVENGTTVLTVSRFVSSRVYPVVQSGNTTHLQILRLILVLVKLFVSLKRVPGKSASAKKLPPEEHTRRILSGDLAFNEAGSNKSSVTKTLIPQSMVDAIKRRFSSHTPWVSKKEITLLQTTICALTLLIPPMAGGNLYPNAQNELATNPEDIRNDLQLTQDTVRLYFRELGCRVNNPSESEYAKFGVVKGKSQAARMRIMRLRVPPAFPKLKPGRRVM